MQLEARPTVTVQQRHELRALVDAIVADLIDDGALDISVDTAPAEEGEALRVVVRSDKLPLPRVVSVKESA